MQYIVLCMIMLTTRRFTTIKNIWALLFLIYRCHFGFGHILCKGILRRWTQSLIVANCGGQKCATATRHVRIILHHAFIRPGLCCGGFLQEFKVGKGFTSSIGLLPLFSFILCDIHAWKPPPTWCLRGMAGPDLLLLLWCSLLGPMTGSWPRVTGQFLVQLIFPLKKHLQGVLDVILSRITAIKWAKISTAVAIAVINVMRSILWDRNVLLRKSLNSEDIEHNWAYSRHHVSMSSWNWLGIL